ncbi:exonuclease [Bosea sp. LC85]|uniref:3'-5' exonuclease n=1 Tax=Bosea sp. LC85 TaxID=1502851 RepID=UPI0004E46A41|nr:3'-5' exonuclease [Bosea sp. LC85]KFC64019.1 exonuclease [Bosea sp. LC85]
MDIDLETLSSAPDAAIVAIGACTFATDGSTLAARRVFRQAVHPDTSQKAGGRIDALTVVWWMGQSTEARQAWTLAPARSIQSALQQFALWCLPEFDGERVRVWGNGAGFDNVILRGAYDRCEVSPPWRHQDDRCYRTLKNLRPDIAYEQTGTAHEAADDAVSQALHAERIFAAMKGA